MQNSALEKQNQRLIKQVEQFKKVIENLPDLQLTLNKLHLHISHLQDENSDLKSENQRLRRIVDEQNLINQLHSTRGVEIKSVSSEVKSEEKLHLKSTSIFQKSPFIQAFGLSSQEEEDLHALGLNDL